MTCPCNSGYYDTAVSICAGLLLLYNWKRVIIHVRLAQHQVQLVVHVHLQTSEPFLVLHVHVMLVILIT